MQRLFLLVAMFAACSAMVLSGPRAAAPVVQRASSVKMVDPSAVDAASQLLAIADPGFTPAKTAVMAASNLLVMGTTKIQGKSLIGGTKHDEMVDTFGMTWLLATASLVRKTETA
mmetsp:Transcript_40840/g.89666  ORF Transcript_40840/g.89666 Transcript_40840/m.89666 type:complete len:115 (+) Transcript_40840:68-412(+)